mmetsp:Transcript_5205/g.8552  ORF Transcript_5205/g.8552 Transcript_5205/m.8552 type:complete len:553 (-) Transcript_5205:443-2101(-)|eukprot:CAMPEP_0184339974 /NCGR_PEP_ID=MMETSP1089-20130417/8649_1 /TAXON_ID=38269 ORGANISM="Gloeochaete wittrockiana, Strain SAG46.84" /NCGR_SAMPLE_ID=MMETSP1089 /ASSEMBLY_ACC=CAM_ASM_000445 /LENGTH=552 /DNA_ID=CAMNT_0026667535 /DNA_START=35 /DNA_END=1693 /DNA_ORIENTATION=-
MAIASTPEWAALAAHVAEIDGFHLRYLLKDEKRAALLTTEFEGIYLDYSRQRVTDKTIDLLLKLADVAGLKQKLHDFASGKHINTTEDRAALHIALRAEPTEAIYDNGDNVVPKVHEVLNKIKAFSEKIRGGEWKGVTGKTLTDVVCIGIGGSYLGPEFAYEALRTDAEAKAAATGRRLRFLANVDPVDVARALEGLTPETTLVVVVSKTFTTAETMLNARTIRNWVVKGLAGHADAVSKHMVAVSTNLPLVEKFGIDPVNAFGFWDWVGGRYSVCSAVGVVPLALQYGFPIVHKFLAGAHSIDKHLLSAPFGHNIPVLLGLLGVWNSSFLKYSVRALLPYSQALLKLAPHIQQVDMESNGKRVALDGSVLPFEAGEVNFGEPGTNGQHSFYQLIHQGRVIPCDFIGFVASQNPINLEGEVVSNHDELMSNFFAQPDALAMGKTEEELKAENVPAKLIPHKVFTGNRPSSSLLFPQLNAYVLGQLLAIYEHRTVVEGFVWGINSFDQWGVELGKVLATKVRNELSKVRKGADVATASFNPSTATLLQKYLKK